MSEKLSISDQVQDAIRHFWDTRSGQGKRQGSAKKALRDRGSRASVTGGKQLDGFVQVIFDLLIDSGIKKESIKLGRKEIILPGFFRPTKQWDLLITVDGKLLAALEMKSQFGSLGNNSNNRAEEAIGSAQDFWTAFREGAFASSDRPWLGYLFLLEDSSKSRSPVKCETPNFPVFKEFDGASYVDRYTLLCKRLTRERLYDATALLLCEPSRECDGVYSEPSQDATFEKFAKSLLGHISAHV